MGNVIMCAGGGGVKSDDVTATLANVLEGKTALTSDSDDDIGTGTMPECGAITLAPTGNNTLTSGEGHYDSVTADGSLAYAAGLSDGYEKGVAAGIASIVGKTWASGGQGITCLDSDSVYFYPACDSMRATLSSNGSALFINATTALAKNKWDGGFTLHG